MTLERQLYIQKNTKNLQLCYSFKSSTIQQQVEKMGASDSDLEITRAFFL